MTNKSILERYLESWVIIYHNEERIVGYLKDIDEGYLILNPFQSGRLKENGSLRYYLNNDPKECIIPMINLRIEPTKEGLVKKDIHNLNKISKRISNNQKNNSGLIKKLKK